MFRTVKRLGNCGWRNGGASRAIADDAALCTIFRARRADSLPAMAVILANPVRVVFDEVGDVWSGCVRGVVDEHGFIPEGTHE
jgi:hypothetical protein